MGITMGIAGIRFFMLNYFGYEFRKKQRRKP